MLSRLRAGIPGVAVQAAQAEPPVSDGGRREVPELWASFRPSEGIVN